MTVGRTESDLFRLDASLQIDVSVGGGQSNRSGVESSSRGDVTVGSLEGDFVGVERLSSCEKDASDRDFELDVSSPKRREKGAYSDVDRRVPGVIQERSKLPSLSEISDVQVHPVCSTFEGSEVEGVGRVPKVAVSRGKIDGDLEGDVIDGPSVSNWLFRSLARGKEGGETVQPGFCTRRFFVLFPRPGALFCFSFLSRRQS